MNEETIQLTHLSIGYRVKNGRKPVATDLNASIRSGQLTCLLGANGAGKSTLLRTLSAFQPRLGGDILIQGRSIDSYNSQQLSKLIGVVLTEKPDIRNMTVDELVAAGRSPYTDFWGRLSADDRRTVNEAIDSVGIADLKGRMIDTLSDGERQKVMIAKALAQQTPIVYMDEPTAFLDYPTKVETMLLLRQICRKAGKTIFLSTHDVELALQTADVLWVLDRQRGLHMGTTRELAADGVLSAFIDRPQVAFDRQTYTIRVTKD